MDFQNHHEASYLRVSPEKIEPSLLYGALVWVLKDISFYNLAEF
jgi:hypothetical protein